MVTEPDVLFPDLVPLPTPEPEPALSVDRRRTLRQHADVEAGRHPLTRGKLAEDPDAQCGNCRYREVIGHHNRSYAKCVWVPTSADAASVYMPPRASPTLPRLTCARGGRDAVTTSGATESSRPTLPAADLPRMPRDRN